MSMPTLFDQLLEVAAQQRGFITAGDAEDLDINPVELRKMAGRGRLERVGHGVYRLPTFPRRPHDELMAAVLWTGKRGVIGGQTALELHGLCDVNPRRVDLTVPPDYRPRKRGGERYRIRQAKLSPGEVEEVDDIPVVIPVRAIREGIADGVDPRLIEQAISTARQRGEFDMVGEAALRQELDRTRRVPPPARAAGTT